MSQTAAILEVLSDRKPHSVAEIHSRAGTSRLNSRISDLRAQGYVIDCWTVKGKTNAERYVYRLLFSPELLTEPEARGVAQVPGEMGSRPSQSTGLEPRRTEHAGVIAPPAGLDGRPEVAPGPVDASGSVSSIGGSLGDAAVPATSYERPEARPESGGSDDSPVRGGQLTLEVAA